ncbi:hypothetical protein [Tolypothrix sp. VBCCA 56010]|uniref:hypothetical protein n=1 Tax=Tolypothrix sp. VBCCA 56010 TaxID=3137731 RepID=UPI003D7CA914
MFKSISNHESDAQPFIAPEEMALLPHNKEASNFIALSQKQRLNVLEALLLERVANDQNCDDVLNAIDMLKPSSKQASTNRNISHTERDGRHSKDGNSSRVDDWRGNAGHSSGQSALLRRAE